MTRAIYANSETEKLERFFDSVFAAAESGHALDSVSSRQTFSAAKLKEIPADEIPASVMKVAGELGDEGYRALDAVVIGMKAYRDKHGVLPTADIIESALHQGYSMTDASLKQRGDRAFDGVGGSEHHDSISSQPNRAVVAIVSAIAEAIPFAAYLPADIGSNESRLVIVSHQAGTETGDYAEGDLLDGVNAGGVYLASERRVDVTLGVGNTTGTAQIAAIVGDNTSVELLRGRTQVFVNGLPVAAENPMVGAAVANSPISGVANIAGTDYTVGGTVTVATGAVALTFNPALPNGTEVEVEGYIDYERQPELAPKIVTQAQTFPLYASAWRGIVQQTPDASTQYAQEIGVDMQSEGLITVRAQQAMERHYMALAKVMKVAQLNGNIEIFDFGASTQLADKTRSQIMQDLFTKLSVVSQKMAEDTMEYGIKYIYVGINGLSLLRTLPETLFKPSGITARPSIYWAGTLFDGTEVYYTPKLVADAPTAFEILCIGRSAQVSRSPIVLGDSVAPMYKTLGVNTDLKSGVGVYARNFTAVNPHKPSALGCGIVQVTDVG